MLKLKECKKLMKKCKTCGELKLISDFYKKGKNKNKDKYESQCKACKYNKTKSRYSLVCLKCGKEFTTAYKKQKFCSNECKAKSQRNREEVLCDYCRKPIKRKKSEIEKSNHHFCNKECEGKWKYNSVEVLCDYCRKPIKIPKCRSESSDHNFCNKKCHGKWDSENKKGENSHNWNSNLTDKDRQDRRLIEGYSDFIKQVLERDDYTCQLTNKRGGKLEVHHLNCYSDFKEGRTDINNCITLSKEIHRLFHKIYGKKHNTKEQFEEFKHRYHNKEFKEVI